MGMVIVYTGDGKGKTTAALGLAIRGAGYNKKILIVQFGKNTFSGELKSLKKLKIKIIQGGKGFVGILGDKFLPAEHKRTAQETFKKLYKETVSGKWDIVIADEILGALKCKFLLLPQVLDLIKNKPGELDIVLTGRGAPKAVIAKADLVTEMKSIKHPYEKNIPAKKGIDF
ncbi:hypothetical protein A2617_01060 [Candidatus Daviesbacteria bacterium RIFOXYD1_FULL_41_10]|uniref:Cob(I)yrinic acid a,c-diamide adenosyltransferase n=1 Tax=Candidatus Daviesbacteria bacterium RIFOXYD1_FULL_41_10 TaxID=1797801 RepID=A0A1F5N0B3_9BACT|nr:MAG: hypothetical protein A2617_01060 [Candidatus Daviesbacteria bacterium RIFOXYD1_FULL_41_10]